jgi:hypothetical protein
MGIADELDFGPCDFDGFNELNDFNAIIPALIP